MVDDHEHYGALVSTCLPHLLLLSKQQLAVLLSGSFTAAHLRLTKTRSCCETNTIQVVKNIATTATANFAELCDKVFVVNAP